MQPETEAFLLYIEFIIQITFDLVLFYQQKHFLVFPLSPDQAYGILHLGFPHYYSNKLVVKP